MIKRTLLIAILACLVILPVFASTGASNSGAVETWFGLGAGALCMGMVVNAANLAAMFKSYTTVFNEAFVAAQPQYPKVAMVVPSSTRSNNYAWMASLSSMREWIGDRHIENLKNYIYEILNKTWENTFGVPREDIEDDQYGVYAPAVAHQAATVAVHPDVLVFGLLNTAFTALAYDGKTFFALDHDFGANRATYVLSADNYGKAIALLGRLKKPNGEYFYTGTEKLTLVTGPELEGTSKAILNSQFISVTSGSTQDNVWKGSADYVKSSIISSTTAWFILVEFNTLKPIILQKRRDPKFTQLTDPNNPEVFKSNIFTFGVDARYNAGYGLPQLGFGSTGLG